MLEDLMKSMRGHIEDRLASPLLFGFAASWALWNYRFLVILFSDASVSTTFYLIDTIAFPDLSSKLCRGVVFPALTTLAYVFVYPYPAKFVFAFTRHRQQELNAIHRDIENQRLLTSEESRAIHSELLNLQRVHGEEVDRLTREIDRLRQAAGVEKVQEPWKPVSEFSESQLLLMLFIESLGGMAHENELRDHYNATTQYRYDLGELLNKGLLNKSYDQDEEIYYIELTHEGRAVLIKSTKLAKD